MPITILDYVKSLAGDKECYPAADFDDSGVAMIGGCERCAATLGPYNAYPSTSGYWRCADCIGDTGFVTVADFTSHVRATYRCPSCGEDDNVHGTHIADEPTGVLECGECGEAWAP